MQDVDELRVQPNIAKLINTQRSKDECKPKLFGLIDGHKWKFVGWGRGWFYYEVCTKCWQKSKYHAPNDDFGQDHYRTLITDEQFHKEISDLTVYWG